MRRLEIILILFFILVLWMKSYDGIGSHILLLISCALLAIIYAPFGYWTFLSKEKRSWNNIAMVTITGVSISACLASIFYNLQFWNGAQKVSIAALSFASINFVFLVGVFFNSSYSKLLLGLFTRSLLFGVLALLIFRMDYCGLMRMMYNQDEKLNEAIEVYCNDKSSENEQKLYNEYNDYWENRR